MKFEIDKKTMADAKMIGTQAMKALVFISLLMVAGGAAADGNGLPAELKHINKRRKRN